jgi:hypothetical protein
MSWEMQADPRELIENPSGRDCSDQLEHDEEEGLQRRRVLLNRQGK